MSRSSDCHLNCLRPDHLSKDCNSGTCSVPKYGRQHVRPLHREFSEKEETTTKASDATTVVLNNITQGDLPVVRIKLTNRDLTLSMLAIFDSAYSRFKTNQRYLNFNFKAAMHFFCSRDTWLTGCQA